jgi:hypothetical protein
MVLFVRLGEREPFDMLRDRVRGEKGGERKGDYGGVYSFIICG